MIFAVLVPAALAVGSVGLLVAWRRGERQRRLSREYLSRIG